ncbi:Hint domain-containing protein [Planktotalea sp.]|uniref:Hint domain-containing protein n=1 Tax=Planktotalea sp. TaxID=2029877 RepID=UPI00329A41C5
MAFISEIHFRGTGVANDGEFTEITLGPDDDPADFVVSVYDDDGTLHTGAGITGGEVNLSTLTGTPDPDNADFTVYVIPVGIRNAASDADEGSGIALTDTSTNTVISFFSADNIAPITATAGAASGETSDSILEHTDVAIGESFQWDIFGNSINGTFTPGDAVLCITSESQVRTKSGSVKGKALKVGDLVWTHDHGYQPIRWIGSKILSNDDLLANPKNRPVSIAAHALGQNTPAQALLVSLQHRILARSKVAERMFDSAEILVAAIKLVGLEGIAQITPPNGVHYIHILFDQHEIIDVDGAAVESLLVAERSEKVLSELDTVRPLVDTAKPPMAPARPIIEGKRCKTFIQRLQKNNKPLLDTPSEHLDMRRAG